MKKLFTLTLVFLFGIGFSNAENNSHSRTYTNNFIFNQDGIEFAVFPDGQFDFNYLQDRNGIDLYVNTGNLQVSFNTGYNYNRFVQYDSYGAVIQIEETPVFYDSYGRVIQIGEVLINYRGGYINHIGNMNVFYSRPGIIDYYSGYINVYNRNYIYQPWHNFYSVPLVNRCIVYYTPYRLSYFPLRYAWSYHRNYWNTPSYYNGYYARSNVRRNFYRPYDQVNYRSFERGQRNARGRAIAENNRVSRSRQAIVTGRSQVTRTNSSRSSVATQRTSGRHTTATNTRSSSRNGINREAVNNRSDRTISTTARNARNTSRSATLNVGDATTKHSATTRTNRNTNANVDNRVNRTERAVTRDSRINNKPEVTRSTRHTTPKRSSATTRSANRNNTAVNSENSTSRNTQAKSSRTSSNKNATRSSGSKRSHKRG
ncbi:hypothetical protein P700755_000881 [Psychroflexus torquis ATCC 700755]|uniref:Secreted protein n=1 Tax=Psychroflexus torquis (strain ATCC 700755 / CIP 106069 / ACAM 623) TaxID=313595 RepID=K4IQU7_PSYTT|nr:hypothetical protein [Psychroflexus torquis]AFU67860.1 hypothetical protein P700755_000881 [Psychroflexus torquis ATCC 700755]